MLISEIIWSSQHCSPEVIDHIGHAEKGQYEGARPAVAFPDEVAARCPSLTQSLFCNGSVQHSMVPSERKQAQIEKLVSNKSDFSVFLYLVHQR